MSPTGIFRSDCHHFDRDPRAGINSQAIDAKNVSQTLVFFSNKFEDDMKYHSLTKGQTQL